LQQYWGYPHFRPLQEDIVNQVLAGRDTLALLPTGGGKSICFQVPGMALEGLTIVISPLIALMRDQVEQLTKREIPATYINSTLSASDIDRKLQKAMDGDYKFLYLAPERLQTEMFAGRVQKMNVALIAVDEAHCISQWGYDFRPSYLEIAKLREWLPNVPIIALTATAPPSVRDDIAQRLELKNPAIFTQSFRRENLHYQVEHSERIADRILEIVQNTPGTGIVYARTRKRVKAIAEYLQRNGVAAAAYHGGMKTSDRNEVQEAWIQDKIRVMAATNAFGMGIDKPNVRFVIHYNLPADPESYYQEAGRGGRDGADSLALAFHNEQDLLELEQFVSDKYPSWDTLNQHFDLLCDFFDVQTDGPPAEMLKLDLAAIAEKKRVNPVKLYNSIQILDQAGLMFLNEQPDDYAYLQVLVRPQEVILYKERYADRAFLLDFILRNLGGAVYQDDQRFLPAAWARNLQMDPTKLHEYLLQFAARGIVSYRPSTSTPMLRILAHRRRLVMEEVGWDKLEFLKQRAKDRFAAMLQYIQFPGKVCRSRILEAYFGELGTKECGKCDFCISKTLPTGAGFIQQLGTAILAFLGESELEMRQLIDNVSEGTRDQRIDLIREMLDKGILVRGEGLLVRRRR
jgi:ATP-dependent DNA helicase RecQ